ncbi:sugar transferase [Rhodococcus sp. RD6.2]|uniref:sugar transferase n=1 Tax=Rhodococcus sp. RD6.2 TaxID=260936 RepID=UPI0020A1369F|nr:sugar transferase [Rhodococcus sp. RD6.2]
MCGRPFAEVARPFGAWRLPLPLPPPPRPGWESRYGLMALGVDVLSLLAADLFVSVFYHDPEVLEHPANLAVALAVPICALLSLALNHAWDPRILGCGPEEFRRVASAYVTVIAVMAVAGYAAAMAGGHSWVFGTLPLAAAASLAGRKLLRTWLHRRRRSGAYLRSVVAAGDEASVRELIHRTRAATNTGWNVEAICLSRSDPAQELPLEIDGVPVVGTERDVVGIVALRGFAAVALLPSIGWTPARTQRLAWDLEGTGADLLIAPALMDIVGPRLHISPVAGTPLLQLSAPRFTGPAWVVKSVLDRVLALGLLIAMLPLLLAVGGAIRLTSPGPAFYRQTRVGRAGTTFEMIKFRSMVRDADTRLAALSSADEGAGVLFKIKDDPRVTRVGHFIRRYSIDELPQLFNVVAGHMSLVGPRPPLIAEVEKYDDGGVRRRMLVKPGLTGLWQVSGRSDLSWEESVRMDLRYVENWSMTLDLMILWKTAAAVFRAEGAY